MRRLIIFIAFLTVALFSATAQKPYWIKELPVANSGSYYYRVTRAEAKTYEEAYSKAFSIAILESSWKIGVRVDTKNDLETIEKGIIENINVSDRAMKIPLNKVCEYTEKASGTMNIRIYILWQVARYGNIPPNFEDFSKCE